nr:hypothetical protein [Tanacetum cinerariifolium]
SYWTSYWTTSESKSMPLPLSTLFGAFLFDTDTPGVSLMTIPVVGTVVDFLAGFLALLGLSTSSSSNTGGSFFDGQETFLNFLAFLEVAFPVANDDVRNDDDDVDSDAGGDYEVSDSEKNDEDENPNLNQNDDEEEEYEAEYVHTPNDDEFTDDDDEEDEELYKDVNIRTAQTIKSQIHVMVDAQLSARLGDSIQEAFMSYTIKFEMKVQVERKRYIDLVENYVEDIIKDEVKSQLPHILPKKVSEFATPNNPKGQEYPFDLSKPLPLIEDRGRQVVLVNYFINNELEYLKGGSSSRKYTTSTTKTKDAKYDDIQGIKDMVQKKQVIRSDELYKFSDETLTSVRSVLHDISSNLMMGYFPKRRRSTLDKQRGEKYRSAGIEVVVVSVVGAGVGVGVDCCGRRVTGRIVGGMVGAAAVEVFGSS